MKFKHFLLTILVIVNLILLIWNSALFIGATNTMFKLEEKISILFPMLEKKIEIFDLMIGNKIKRVEGNVDKIESEQEKIDKELQNNKLLNIENPEEILEANLFIFNKTRLCSGSGTHIKIKKKSYILTCFHLINKLDDEIYAVSDNGEFFKLEIVRFNPSKDLLLLKADIGHLSHLEISDENPKEGSEVYVVGNPDGLKDIITDGVISKVEEDGYLLTNLVFFGNSGGAVIYKGKIIGVLSQIITYSQGATVNYSYSSKVEVIREFVRGIR